MQRHNVHKQSPIALITIGVSYENRAQNRAQNRAHWHTLIHISTHWYILVHIGTYWHTWYILVHTGRSRLSYALTHYAALNLWAYAR